MPADHGGGQMADLAVPENPAELAPGEPGEDPRVDNSVHSQLSESCPSRKRASAAAHGAGAAAPQGAAASASAGV